MSHVVINNPALAQEREVDQARVVVHIDALPEHLARGWELVGPCSDRYRDPLLSDEEQFLADQARAALEADIAAEAARVAAAAKPASVSPDPITDPDGENAGGTTEIQE